MLQFHPIQPYQNFHSWAPLFLLPQSLHYPVYIEVDCPNSARRLATMEGRLWFRLSTKRGLLYLGLVVDTTQGLSLYVDGTIGLDQRKRATCVFL